MDPRHDDQPATRPAPARHRASRSAPGTMARLLGHGEDPGAWSFPLGRVLGTDLRVHWCLVLWVAAELVAWLPHDAVGLVHVVCVVAALIVLALLREFARVWVARRRNVDASVIVLWPLGGLAPLPLAGLARPLWSEAGGAVAGLLLIVLAASAALLTGVAPDALWADPLDPRVAAGTLRTLPQVAAWWSYEASVLLAIANLLPLPCFDAGRVLTGWWRRRAGLKGGIQAARVGLTTAAFLAVAGAVGEHTRLIILAVFGAGATYLEFRRAEFIEASHEPQLLTRDHTQDQPQDQAQTPDPPDGPGPASELPLLEITLDDVLEKISRDGLGALSEAERAFLAKETSRRRGL